MNKASLLILCIILSTFVFGGETSAGKAPIELGTVRWLRDLPTALNLAKKTDKPIFLLFQEVPGCSTCSIFGREILSHPLLIEAIEDLFVPVAIFNNRSGMDKRILERYREPSWNFPVVRYLGHDGVDLIPRKDRIWKIEDTLSRMVEALRVYGRDIPNYLKLFESEQASQKFEIATFAMHCYWDGEARLGSLNGVKKTRAGWLYGKEVVEVQYDPRVLPYKDLVTSAQAMDCANGIFAHSDDQLAVAKRLVEVPVRKADRSFKDARDSDQKFALKRTLFRYLPLTHLQATKVNSALRLGSDPQQYLSPRQIRLLGELESVSKDYPHLLNSLEVSENLVSYNEKLTAKLASVGISLTY